MNIPITYIKNYGSELITVENLIESVLWVNPKAVRKECFMSVKNRTYQYDGEEGYVYKSVSFTPHILQLLEEINKIFLLDLNVCFLNYYEDEKYSLGWHSDDSEAINHKQPIVVMSYGQEREIWFKPNNYKGVIPPEWRKLLHNGSFLSMQAGMQKNFLHRIPKGDRPMGPRVSLTFRCFND